MEYRVISRIVSKYLFFFSLTFCIPLIISIYFDYIIPLEERTHPPSTSAFFLTILITLALAFIFVILDLVNMSKYFEEKE